MKKSLIILLVIFLIAGCNQADDAKNKNDIAFLEKPQILCSIEQTYREDNGWLTESKEITGDYFKASGKGIILELIFNTQIDYESVKEQVKLIGYDKLEIGKHYNKENALRLVARDIEHGKSYKLYIPKSIKDINENALEKDIEINIVLEEATEAFYTFMGQEKTIDNLGEIIDNPRSVHFSLPITNKSINLMIDFTKKVNIESVEKSIRKSLGPGVDIYFEWVNPKKLKLNLKNLPANKEYLISLAEAIDENNNNIIGNLFFTVLEPSQLCSINIQSGEDKLLKEFIDMPYMIVPSEDYQQYFIADDVKKNYVLDIKQNTLIELPAFKYSFGNSFYEWYSAWLDSYSILALEIETNTIYIHNLKNKQVKKLFSLPSDLAKREVYDLKLSPDKKKIAITFSNTRTMDLYVFSLKGKMLYGEKEVAKTNTRNNSTNSMYLQWLNDKTIIFQDTRDVIKLDISTKNKEILITDAIEPIACQYSTFVFAKKSGAYLYDMAKNAGNHIGLDFRNVFFINENQLIYNEPQHLEIVLFDFSRNTKRIIGRGSIIGVSPEKETVYYLKNYCHLYGYYYLE